jgi:indole-3-glycerol phosphate synthase
VLEARAAGADLVLLIVAALPQHRLESLHEMIRELGMTPLVEAHSDDEVARAVDLGSQLIGVNARDLRTFELDRDLFGRVADQIPAGVVRVAESAVLDVADVERYREAGADAVLVGEALVTGDPVATLQAYLSV